MRARTSISALMLVVAMAGMAFWIVSSGTDAERAFWYMVRRVGFISGSPPPSRAATSTWRISLAKSFPREASAAPFLCLIVAHLE